MTFAAGPDLVGALSLRPHPEGGWFRGTWRSEQSFAPAGYGADTPDEVGSVRLTLGGDVGGGEQTLLVVPGGVWQCASPAARPSVLVSCVVAPGFDYADFRLHQRDE